MKFIQQKYEQRPKNVNEVNVNTTDEVNNINDPPPSVGLPTSTYATFQWGELNREACIVAINEDYEEIVCWKRNIFLLPSGKVGKAFIKELARLYQAYADESPLECIALKACSVMQSVLLQKPHAKSKSKEHVVCLERRLNLWSEGRFKELISEGKCIQNHMSSSPYSKPQAEIQNIAKGFNRLMLQGKVRQAVNLLSNANRRGLLPLDSLIPVGIDNEGNTQWKSTKEILLDKHPHGRTYAER